MKMSVLLKCSIFGFALAAVPALASDDSSSDAAPGFHDVQESSGVLIRVPIDQNGRELADAAEMRVHKGIVPSATTEMKTAFEMATAIPTLAVSNDSSTSSDTSTHGGYGWNNWNNSGWQSSNYYYSYTPTYNYYGTYYTYYQPTYYNYYPSYGSSNYYGYRYYYYRHCW